jgi:hypothetical protein
MQNQHIAPPPHMRSLSNYYFRFQVFVGAAVYCHKESFSQAALVAAASRSLPGQRPPQISSSAHIRICCLTFTVIAVLFERQRSSTSENARHASKSVLSAVAVKPAHSPRGFWCRRTTMVGGISGVVCRSFVRRTLFRSPQNFVRWVWGSECSFKGESPGIWDIWDDANFTRRETNVPCNAFPADTSTHRVWGVERVGDQFTTSASP